MNTTLQDTVNAIIETMLLLQMVGDAGDDHTSAEQQRGLDCQRGLVVQQVLPPLRWDELRQDNREHIVVVALIYLIHVGKDRPNEAAVGRVQHLQRHTRAPLLPLRAYFHRLVW